MTVHIFAGGVIDDTGFIQIENGDRVVCADRGYTYAERMGIKPDMIVGDFDSYSGIFPENTEIIRSVPEKDDTDTMLAIKSEINHGAKRIKIYGATGGRFDHTFANIQSLKYALEHGCDAVIEDSRNIIMLQDGGRKCYTRRNDWYFSVFAYSEKLDVRELSGVKYPLKNYTITSGFPIGVSNEFTADNAILDIADGTAVVIMSAF